ncbi:MAG: hypothetical protein IKV54_02270, partial [Clostridia bacterium]|nr:hypothetical protein [Clostridia bacterium]
VTTPDGIELVAVLDEETSGNNTDANLLVAENAKDVTIEGVGSKAEIYQFGIGFMYSDSIEIRNLSFRHYPEDGLQLLAYGSAGACNLHGYYWVHNNTFKEGLDNWGVGDADGDESVSLADVRNVTFSFNKFYKTGKTLILGGWEYDACMNMTFHHNYYFLCGQRLPLSRNSNIHNYNNYFAECQRGLSPRVSTYVFSEANYFDGVGEAYYGDSGSEPFGAIKSFGDIYRNTGADDMVVKVTERDAYVENTCMPDEKTDYTRFDTDPELFYYDAVNKRSDVDLIHEAKELPDFVPKYAGAGILARLEFPTVEG